MQRFKCTRCGICCSNLLDVNKKYQYGLYLNTEEVKFFPPDTTHPLFRSNGRVIAYQVGVRVCPNLEKGRCRIYNDRPLGCRTFPLVGFHQVDKYLCSYASKYKDEKWDWTSLEMEHRALRDQEKELDITPEATEMYLFNLKIWISYDRLKTVLSAVS
jgi:Fe-S-cluster containining protein